MAKKFTRKLTRVSSHSYTITIPKELIKTFKWRERQKLEIIVSGTKPQFLIRDWVPPKKAKKKKK